MTEQKIKICYLNRSKLSRYDRNAMQHSDEQIEQIVDSIKAFGWTNPILIDETGEIIAGHGRLAAAEQLDIEEIPTITLKGLSDAQKRAYRLADNQLPRNAGWDEVLLSSEIEELQDLNFDISLIGFSDLEINGLLNTEPDNPSDHWVGMPDFKQEDQNGFHRMVVHFETAQDLQDFAGLVGQKLTDKTKYMWFPEHHRDEVADKAYISDESAISSVHSK